MADIISKENRSLLMASVGQKHTKPEVVVRRELHALGFRFRLHDSKLPGRPDILFPRYHSVIMVHGCFWHGHGCRRRPLPESNAAYWRQKIERNMARDAAVLSALETLGWRSLVVWECAVLSNSTLRKHAIARIADWLREDLPSGQIGRSDLI
ncbi:very short patch repair endonuclease [Mesorhizobium sp. VK23B]|uniref:Very short patch repair endonuclease n=1 Tax=Mesorhizobium dulcispinae TaxID=3072316 RepID=A0ABU4XA30_9HYPH|nr:MULTISPECIES: very short patch repair endonuclease [unclassified Mesorhizobium]MDX8465744.1 very short patch repair endonuclease [Mesorhizobium sp. VK23B]MDX8471454.1 very short patch repair endonuclease [Mesorhizobium sp. VK23A]